MGRLLLPSSPLQLSRSLFAPLSCHPSLLFKFRVSYPSRITRKRLLINNSLRCPNSSRYGGWDDPLVESSEKIESFLRLADGKCAILFFLGFFTALALSRVRIWNLASLILAGSGFAFGLMIGVSRFGGSALDKRRTNKELLDEFGAKISEVKSRFQGLLDVNHHGSGEIERFLGVVESIDLAAAPVRKIVQNSVKLNPKLSKRKREAGTVGFDFFRFLQFMFKEGSIPRVSPKVKTESVERLKNTNDEVEVSANEPVINDEEVDPWLNEQLEDEENERSETFSSGVSKSTVSSASSIDDGNVSLRARDYGRNDGLLNGDPHIESTKDDKYQEIFQHSSSKSDAGSNGKISQNAEKQKIPIDSSEQSSSSSSLSSSSEEEFDRIVMRGSGLLRDAGECLKRKGDEQTAEIFLYKSSRLLQIAVAMKPMNPLALGQLGNSCLLHGELKLKISRDLRNILLKKNSPNQSNFLKKEKMVSALVNVCEECEQLLIDAGRNYKMILAIDEMDVKALYNWGLALSFRAELIADTGPDAAVDADKIYMAAIEKFDAVMSRSGGSCSSDALYRWGLMLRRRSQLRPPGSSEKLKLLQQAKTIFEDVLRVDTKNLQVRQALRSCISDLR